MNLQDMLNDESFRKDSDLQFLIGSYYESIANDPLYADEDLKKALNWYKLASEGGHEQAKIFLNSIISRNPLLDEDETRIAEYEKYLEMKESGGKRKHSQYIKIEYIKNQKNEAYLLVHINDVHDIRGKIQEHINSYREEKPLVIGYIKRELYNDSFDYSEVSDIFDLLVIGTDWSDYKALYAICALGASGEVVLCQGDLKYLKEINSVVEISNMSGETFKEIAETLNLRKDYSDKQQHEIVMFLSSGFPALAADVGEALKILSYEKSSTKIGFCSEAVLCENKKTLVLIRTI